jgi:uncharacterized lipoprotein YddW (UPF0748 family)
LPIRRHPRRLTLAFSVALALVTALPAVAAPRPRTSPGKDSLPARPWGWGMVPDSSATDSVRGPVATPKTDGAAPRVPGSVAADSLRGRPAAPAAIAKPDGAAFLPGKAKPDPEPTSASESETRPIDYLWVLRDAIVTRASIDSVVSRAQAMGVRGLLVQVVGRGDAYYRSSLLPRPEVLLRAPADFDPLAEVIVRAHRAGLEVHAWVNCLLVWSAPRRPRDPRHVVNEHPEWIAAMADGRRMTALDDRDRRMLQVEGVFLSPAHPRVRAHLGAVAHEIAAHYAVDGIHLDYIRQPGVAIGFDPTTRARFALESGVDPERFADLEPARRASVDSAWTAFQRDQVTDVVRAVRESVETARPGLPLSAAVIADTVTAERANAQCWRDWVRDGLLDRVYLMCYAPSVQRVMDQLAAFGRELGTTGRVVPGIAVFNTSPSAAAFKILGARTLGFPLVALYSYDSLFAGRPMWAALRERIATSPHPDGRNP